MAYSDYKEHIFLIWMNLISRGDVTCMMVSASFGYIHFRLVNYDHLEINDHGTDYSIHGLSILFC